MKDVILAVDESIRASGIAIYHGSELVRYGCIKIGKNKSAVECMEHIGRTIDAICREWHPTVFVPEDVYEGKKSIMSYKYNIFIQGMLYERSLRRKDNIFYLYHAARWRKILGIKNTGGRDKLKEADIQYVADNFGLAVCDDNTADAICIGAAYIKEFSGCLPTKKKDARILQL